MADMQMNSYKRNKHRKEKNNDHLSITPEIRQQYTILF